MSIHNADEFKIEQNGKKYSISISIEEDQLSLALTLFSNPPQKYSGFFSLNELRISSKIFNHTKTLFEAKEILKRTIIKKQLIIEENDFKANITLDTGLGHDSVPFPIILFRDATEKLVNMSQLPIMNDKPKDSARKSKINKTIKKININNNINLNNNIINDTKSVNTNKTAYLRASIGNNINNKMLEQNKKTTQIVEKNNNNLGNIEFNNSRKKADSKNNINEPKDNASKTTFKQKNNFNENNNNNFFKKVDFINNLNNVNSVKDNKNIKDYITLNNQILHNIYNNMNNANNINSSFYRNLEKSLNQNAIDDIESKNNMLINPIQNNQIQADNLRKNIRNIDNNSLNHPYLKQNLNKSNNNLFNNINNQKVVVNNKINNIPNINNNLLNYKNSKNIQNRYEQIPQQKINQNENNIVNSPAFFAQNPSFNTAPIQRNMTKMTNRDSGINVKKSIKTYYNNEKYEMKLSSSSSEEEDNLDENLDEFSQREQPYHFKNLENKGSKKIKGNLEKFKKSQNMGDYIPSGLKFVSYLKFPDTKLNSNLSMTASTVSSSLTSGSNRIVGIEKNIITSPVELEEITSRLQRILKKRNIKYKLLYKASVDGDLCTKFHEKCDKIPNTLVLIKASGDKRFGGFTTQTWEGEDVNKKDINCFIFSIDKNKIYDINENQEAINCNTDMGPVFINQIKLLDKFFIQGGTTSKGGKTFATLEDFEITGGAEKFGVKEVEVYQVK